MPTVYCTCGQPTSFAGVKPKFCSACGTPYDGQFKPKVAAPTQAAASYQQYAPAAAEDTIPTRMEILLDGQPVRPVARGARIQPQFTTVQALKDGGALAGGGGERDAFRPPSDRKDDTGNSDPRYKAFAEYEVLRLPPPPPAPAPKASRRRGKGK